MWLLPLLWGHSESCHMLCRLLSCLLRYQGCLLHRLLRHLVGELLHLSLEL
jgi:hypothetical protein